MLIPNVPLVVFNAIRLKEGTALVLKSDALVVFFLVFDVSNYVVKVGLAHRECAVAVCQ